MYQGKGYKGAAEVASEPAAEERSDLEVLLRDVNNDRTPLTNQITTLMKGIYTEALSCLEDSLPDFDKAGTVNHAKFQMLRNRILNVGNAKIREIRPVLQDYLVKQIYERRVTTIKVPTSGPFNLPAGVKLPSERVA